MARCTNLPSSSSQRGVAALEFALVAAFFLVLLFAIASYSGLFVVQQALSRAAQEGARAMQQAWIAPSQSGSPQTMACEAVARSVDWLTIYRQGMGLPAISCVSVFETCSYSSAAMCGRVDVVYVDYRRYPLIPELVPLGAFLGRLMGSDGNWMPQDLSARSTVQMGAIPATGA